MRILTYKRTHIGDPNAAGVFGCGDCMGQVRGRDFDAVIGVGGVGAEPRAHGIDGRITWVGVRPRVVGHTPRGPMLMFGHFLLLDSDGPMLAEMAPELARRIYERNVRSVLVGYTARQKREVEGIVSWALSRDARASRLSRSATLNRCVPHSVGNPSRQARTSRKGCRPC
jgi:hypothetical protein